MIDLHTHSTCSDGSESPERVVELAGDAGCSAIALTDHDGLSGLGVARKRADELGVGFVPGCEVSCSFGQGSMHLLCYFIEDRPGPLQNELARLRQDRRTRNTRMTARLAELGLPITDEEVAAQAAGEVVGRPHFAKVLVDKGIVDSIGEAFERYLGDGAPGYIPRAHVEPSDVIDRANASGGVAVLAHPLTLGLEPEMFENEIAKLADAGLSGLECYYGRYDPPTRERLAELAARRRLVATGGSDFHGTFKPELSVGVGLGDLDVGDEILDALRARRPSSTGSAEA